MARRRKTRATARDKSRAFGAAVRRHRLRRHLTQEELGESLDVTQKAISCWELGTASPTLDHVRKLASKLNVRVSTLVDQ